MIFIILIKSKYKIPALPYLMVDLFIEPSSYCFLRVEKCKFNEVELVTSRFRISQIKNCGGVGSYSKPSIFKSLIKISYYYFKKVKLPKYS